MTKNSATKRASCLQHGPVSQDDETRASWRAVMTATMSAAWVDVLSAAELDRNPTAVVRLDGRQITADPDG